MTRHKLVAANITLQIGPSVAVGQRIGRLQSGGGVAREGEEAMLAVFMALRCGLPPPSNERRGVHVGTAKERIGTVFRCIGRSERQREEDGRRV